MSEPYEVAQGTLLLCNGKLLECRDGLKPPAFREHIRGAEAAIRQALRETRDRRKVHVRVLHLGRPDEVLVTSRRRRGKRDFTQSNCLRSRFAPFWSMALREGYKMGACIDSGGVFLYVTPGRRR